MAKKAAAKQPATIATSADSPAGGSTSPTIKKTTAPARGKPGRPKFPENVGKTAEDLRKDVADRKRRSRTKKNFEAEMSKLPANASPAAEIEWVRNHPRMSELDRMADRTKQSRISIEWTDISKTIAGPAPSRAAVAMLQHFCNRPEDFWKQVLSEHKKAVAKGGTDPNDPDSIPEIKEIDKLLMALEGAVNVEA